MRSILATRHARLGPALRDGLFWGLGHTTTLVLFGSVIISSRAIWLHSGYLQAAVSLMRAPFTLRMRAGRRVGAVVLSAGLSTGYGGWLAWAHV